MIKTEISLILFNDMMGTSRWQSILFPTGRINFPNFNPEQFQLTKMHPMQSRIRILMKLATLYARKAGEKLSIGN